MEKLVILLIAAGVGYTAERSSKQLFYTTSNIPSSLYSTNHLAYQHTNALIVPNSHSYPFYSLWSNFGNVGAQGLSQTPNQIQQIPFYHNPVASSSVHFQSQNSHPHPNPFRLQQNYQNNRIPLNFVQGQSQHSPHSNYNNYQYQLPVTHVSQAYDNIWNYDINTLRPKPNQNYQSQRQGVHSVASDRNDVQWHVPLKSYEDIRNNVPSVREPLQDQNSKSFQRGQVESFPQKSSSMEVFLPNTGFTRGHIQAKPGFGNVIANMKSAGPDYKIGFIRGAVEHSNYNQEEVKKSIAGGNRLMRYEAERAEAIPKVVCYFASWSYYRKGKGSFAPENADPSLCTHIVYAFANLDRIKFAIKESDPQLDKDQKFFQRVTALKERNSSLKVLLAIGGWSDSGDDKYSVLAHSPENRRKFARETAKFLKDRNFDGLSFDWHYPQCWQSQCNLGPKSDREAFTEMIKELSSVFQPEGLILSATLSGYQEVIDRAYDIPVISKNLDLMNIMAYDYHGSWETRTGHLAPLFMGPPALDPYPSYNANYTMEYYVSKGADRSKLILGVPMYGQTFQLSNPGDSSYGSEAVGPGMPGEFTQQPGMLAYYEICKKVKDKQWTVKTDRTQSWGPYAYKDDQWVGYDDSDFLVRKARHVKAQNFGGMFVWTMDLDDFQNQCCMGSQPLLRTISKELLGTSYDPSAVDCTPPVVPKPPDVTTLKPSNVATQPSAGVTWWPDTSPRPTTYRPPPAPSIPNPHTTNNPVVSPDSVQTSTNVPITAPTPTTIFPESTSVVLICQQANSSILRPTTPTPEVTTVPPAPSSTMSPSQPETVTVPDNTCDDTWIYKPDPSDCSMYFQCNMGIASKQKCPSGLHWNQYAHTCDWPEYAKCSSTQSTRPTTMQPVWSTSPPQTTPATWATSPATWSTTPSTWPTRPPSTWQTTSRPINQGCKSGEYTPGPNCDQYYLCNDGMQTLQSCGPGLHWNKNKKLCDWPNNAMCKTSADGVKEPVRLQMPCKEGDYFGSEEECDVYFVCNHGKPIQFRCQGGLHWNNNGKICDWPANAGCTASAGSTTTITSSPPIYTEPPPTGRPTSRPSTPRPTSSPVTDLTPTDAPEVVQPSPGSGSKDFMIVCYFTNWAWYRQGTGKYKPENIDPNLCTHIVYGFAVLDYTDLVIKPHDTWADYDNHFYEQVTAFKSRGTKVTLAIGGWNDSAGDKYSRLVNNPSARRKFITSVINFIKKNNFDGLDLDWEYPKCWQVECDKGPASDKPNFATFVREIKEAFRPHGLLLSSAVSPSKTVIDQAYDVPTVSKYLDWIAVMTYDFHGQWDKKTGHVAPLYFHEDDDFAYFNANYSINYWIQQGADRKKIVMGMPLYGQSFTLANENEHGLNAPSIGGGTAGELTRASGFLAYYEICKHVQKDGWTVVKDETGAMGPYAYKGNQWVSYDDVAMIKKKSQLIRDLDLGGGMIWALDLDDFRNTCGQGTYPLLTTIKNILSQPKNSNPSTEVIKVTTQKPTTTTLRTTTRAPTRPPRPVVTTEADDAIIIGELANNHVFQPSPSAPVVTQINKDEDLCRTAPFKPHESDCNKYYMCIHGHYVAYQCAPGTYWNKDHCDWTCGSEPTGSGGGESTSSTTTTTTTTRRPTQHTSTAATTTASGKPWSPAPTTTMGPWRPTSTKPSTSTSWEWKPPIITTTTILPIDVPDTEFMVVCYFTNWAWYRQGIGKYKPEDIDYNLCTHIAYGFAVLNPSTLEIRTHDSWADIDNSFYKLVTDIKSKGKKVVIAIGGWNDSLGDKYSRLVRDAALRRKFINNVIQFIQKYNFDGLDLDWEYPKCWQTDCKLGPESDKANFATFARELKEAFIPYGYSLSSAVTPSKTIIDEGYDVPTINQYLDWIAVMTYDYHGQWDKKTGHVAPMYNHEESDNFYFNSNYTINYWLSKGADKKKIVMGMPMYGQSFTLTQSSNHGLNAPSTGGGQAGEFTRAQGFLAYYEICKNIKGKGWTVVQDESGAIGPYAYKGDQWVSFDDANMIRRKSQYIKDMGLGGGMIWALDLDDFRNVCGCEKHPLLKTINRVLRNYPEPDPKCNL